MKQILVFFLLISAKAFASSDSTLTESRRLYKSALSEFKHMLSDEQPLSFKKGVFLVENAYYGNELEYSKYCKSIELIKRYCEAIIQNRTLLYSLDDKNEVAKQAAIFTVMTDTFKIAFPNGSQTNNIPFTYDFEDYAGEKNWAQMFVTKLIATRKGNCHSLPFLYKILAQEMGTNAYLALAPNHIYVKCFNKKDGWYNTELTSGIFPIDAWLMASGYIHLDAIQNGLYMDTLSEKQSIAVCLVDLAEGSMRKIGPENGMFVLDCCNTALKYFPNYINALLLKIEVENRVFQSMMKSHNIQSPKEALASADARLIFSGMEESCKQLYDLGYRKMPKEMYLSWLISLKEEKDKYMNKNINFNNK